MSLDLNTDTFPTIRIMGNAVTGSLYVNGAAVGLQDLCDLIRYAMTITDLVPNDPRLALLDELKTLTVVPGWNHPRDLLSSRLGHPEKPSVSQ